MWVWACDVVNAGWWKYRGHLYKIRNVFALPWMNTHLGFVFVSSRFRLNRWWKILIKLLNNMFSIMYTRFSHIMQGQRCRMRLSYLQPEHRKYSRWSYINLASIYKFVKHLQSLRSRQSASDRKWQAVMHCESIYIYRVPPIPFCAGGIIDSYHISQFA